MLSNNKIKLIRSLRIKKFRKRNQLIIVEGSKIISEILAQSPELIENIWYLPNSTNLRNTIVADINAHEISLDEMKKISSLESIPDAFALIHFPIFKTDLADQDLILFMDDVQDPGNVGTIIRTAEWYGHHIIICSPRCADRYSSKVVQSSMGSVFRVQVLIMEWEEVEQIFSKHQYYYADMNGNNINDWVNDVGSSVVVIGNEGNGVNSKIKEGETTAISIHGCTNKVTESLNASIAAGIIFHTWGPLS